MNTLKTLTALCLLVPALAHASFNTVQCDLTDGSGGVYGSLNVRFFGPQIKQQQTGHLCSPDMIPTIYSTEPTETSLTLKLKGGDQTFTVFHHPFRALNCADMSDTVTIPLNAHLSIPIGSEKGVADIFADITFTNNVLEDELDFRPRRVKLRNLADEDQTYKIQNCVYSNLGE